MCFWARSPCLRAFWEERALPSGVLGPFDLAPFLRLASARALGRPKFGMSKVPSLAGESGRGGRPQDASALAENRNKIQRGCRDVLVVTELDQLARSTVHLLQIMHTIEATALLGDDAGTSAGGHRYSQGRRQVQGPATARAKAAQVHALQAEGVEPSEIAAVSAYPAAAATGYWGRWQYGVARAAERSHQLLKGAGSEDATRIFRKEFSAWRRETGGAL